MYDPKNPHDENLSLIPKDVPPWQRPAPARNRRPSAPPQQSGRVNFLLRAFSAR